LTKLTMVIDLSRCLGCWSCALGCKEENNEPIGIWWNRILTNGGKEIDTPSGTYPNVTMSYLPINCQHCDNAPCVKVCPVGALQKRTDGIVFLDWNRCIGCRYCLVACPYGIPAFNWRPPVQSPPSSQVKIGAPEVPLRPVGVAEKCTFCFHRVDKGNLTPACIEVCPAGARFFGDLDDPTSQVSQIITAKPTMRLREELGTEPSVYYVPPRNPVKKFEVTQA
jgi:molybdopterin-containing oxidoreductase family iron-sulfur binding subunit